MELSWLMKLRIVAAMCLGAGLIGFLAWPLIAPHDPLGPCLAANMSLGGVLELAGLAFLTGILAYFLTWPYGREIAILAVPAGLAIWAARSGNVAGIIQHNPELTHRQELFSAFRFEPLFWLAIAAVGFAGVLTAQLVARPRPAEAEKPTETASSKRQYASLAIAVIASVLIAQIGIRVLARDVTIASAIAQPAGAQIAFAVFVSFGAAAFVVKKFLDAGYIWPAAASGLVIAFVNTIYVKAEVVQNLAANFPAVFFPNAVCAVLPIQMVAYGILGSVAGYWCAVRFAYWREHEM